MIKKLLLATGVIAAALVPGVAHALPDDDGVYPPDGEQSLDVTAFDSFCLDDAPYVRYEIVTQGFVADPPVATLTITDINGNLIEVIENAPLVGQFLFPGSEIDANGTPIDWPGWVFENGEWREQSVDEPGSDAIWRQGLNIRVDVNPTAFVDPPVQYPDAGPVCLGPPGATPPAPNPPGATPPGATPPQQVGDPSATLPRTGSDSTSVFLQIGALLVVAGGLLAVGSHRRRNTATA